MVGRYENGTCYTAGFGHWQATHADHGTGRACVLDIKNPSVCMPGT